MHHYQLLMSSIKLTDSSTVLYALYEKWSLGLTTYKEAVVVDLRVEQKHNERQWLLLYELSMNIMTTWLNKLRAISGRMIMRRTKYNGQIGGNKAKSKQ